MSSGRRGALCAARAACQPAHAGCFDATVGGKSSRVRGMSRDVFTRLTALALVLGALVVPSSARAASAGPAPFGHQCTTEADGTRFCPTIEAGPGRTVDGVPSFDGIPLDVDVTLPSASIRGPYPTI